MKHEERRKARMKMIYDIVKKCGDAGALHDKLVAIFGVRVGVARRTILEYIKNLIDSGQIKKEGGLLYVTTDNKGLERTERECRDAIKDSGNIKTAVRAVA